MRLDGKVAIVTGAASGIGAGIAERFVEEGASVAILDVNGQGARRVAESLRAKGPVFAVECDVAVEEQVKGAIAQTLERFGNLDVLVNNAGIEIFGTRPHCPSRSISGQATRSGPLWKRRQQLSSSSWRS